MLDCLAATLGGRYASGQWCQNAAWWYVGAELVACDPGFGWEVGCRLTEVQSDDGAPLAVEAGGDVPGEANAVQVERHQVALHQTGKHFQTLSSVSSMMKHYGIIKCRHPNTGRTAAFCKFGHYLRAQCSTSSIASRRVEMQYCDFKAKGRFAPGQTCRAGCRWFRCQSCH